MNYDSHKFYDRKLRVQKAEKRIQDFEPAKKEEMKKSERPRSRSRSSDNKNKKHKRRSSPSIE
jgi:hypothetical protein